MKKLTNPSLWERQLERKESINGYYQIISSIQFGNQTEPVLGVGNMMHRIQRRLILFARFAA